MTSAQKTSQILSFAFYILFAAGTFVAIPIWSYQQQNWWLLFGILFSLIGMISSGGITGLLTCLCIGVWIKQGFSIHQYITFFYFCLLWGQIMSHIGLAYHNQAQSEA
jgi:vacuolar-type H+-ATPase subunit I/STV1